MFADTHAHLQSEEFDPDREKIIGDMSSEGISFIINMSSDIKDSHVVSEMSRNFDNVYGMVGVHPHESKDVTENYLNEIEELLNNNPKILGIGEIGLDYHFNLSPVADQKRVFREQLSLAKKLNVPVSIHVRDAYDDAYKILCLPEIPERKGVIHAFSGDSNWAAKFVNLGFLLGIGGPLTYKKNQHIRDAVKTVGLKNIVTETDCPYLPPVPLRGKRNEPSYIKYVLNTLEDIFCTPRTEIENILLGNATKLFKIVDKSST